MSERIVIAERLRKKEAEIQGLEEKLRNARIYVQALHDVMRALERGGGPDLNPENVLRPGSTVSKARDAILAAGKPIHLNDLLEALGKNGTRSDRASLTSSLAAYVRREEIFTRPAPNTFGLIELGHDALPAVEDEKPPRGFGGFVATVDDDQDDEEIPF